MTTTAWAHLPNARHIDAVLAHVEAHPDKWADAWADARADAWAAAWDATRDATWDAARYVAWDATWEAARGAALDAARGVARDACAALLAWDDAGLLMEVPVDAVRTLAAAGHPPAVLILPARLAMEETP